MRFAGCAALKRIWGPQLRSVLAVPDRTFLKFHFLFLRIGRCLSARGGTPLCGIQCRRARCDSSSSLQSCFSASRRPRAKPSCNRMVRQMAAMPSGLVCPVYLHLPCHLSLRLLRLRRHRNSAQRPDRDRHRPHRQLQADRRVAPRAHRAPAPGVLNRLYYCRGKYRTHPLKPRAQLRRLPALPHLPARLRSPHRMEARQT